MSKKNTKKIRRVIFLGKKSYSINAIKLLLKLGIEIPILILDRDTILKNKGFLEKNTMCFYEDDSVIYEKIEKKSSFVKNIDLVVSYLYWKKIRQKLIDLPKDGCINFHPAPLPAYKGRAGYNTAILDGRDNYGVSVHFIDSEKFDSGPLINIKTFKIDSKTINAYQLSMLTQERLFLLFEETIKEFMHGKKFKLKRNEGGIFLSKKDLEMLKIIKKDETKDNINTKIRAFFFPPYSGAQININGNYYTIVNEEILRYIQDLINEKN